MRKASSKKDEITCEICLYGNSTTGAGWLALFAGRMTGNGETLQSRSFTQAVWLAVDALRSIGAAGSVAIHAPGGGRMAVCKLTNVPVYGDLKWQTAPQYEISEAVAVAAAAEIA